MKLYDCKAVEKLLNDNDWEHEQLNEGCLLMGDFVFSQKGYKTMVVYETPLNESSSAYIVKRFDLTKKRSKKSFENLIQKLIN